MVGVALNAASAAAATLPTFNPVLQSTRAVLNLVACCGLGIAASKKGILDQSAVSALSRLVFGVFQPSLLFTNVMTTLATPAQNKSTLVLLPAFAVLHIIIAALLSKLTLRFTSFSPLSEEGREVRVCSTFANSGPLPLLFVDALFKSHPDPSVRGTAVAYISFWLLAWSPLFWTYGYGVVAGSSNDGLLKKDPSALVGSPSASCMPPRPLWQRWRTFRSSPRFQRVINPPTLGCTLGALIGSISPLRKLFLSSDAPLGPIFDAMKTLGAAYVPCVLLVLAGSLAQGMEGVDNRLFGRAAVVMLQRFVLMPLVAVGLVMAGKHLGILPSDPLLVFVLLLQGCMPSAQNSVLILQLEKKPAAAASLARLLSVVYVLSIVPIGLLLRAILTYVQV